MSHVESTEFQNNRNIRGGLTSILTEFSGDKRQDKVGQKGNKNVFCHFSVLLERRNDKIHIYYLKFLSLMCPISHPLIV